MKTGRRNGQAALALACLFAVLPQATKAADIVDTAVKAGSFKTLAAALQAADLIGALKGQGPFTVFAPTDEAFAKLPKGTVATLLKPENRKQLVSVLTYHVVKGNVAAAQVVKLKGAQTLNGQRIDIRIAGGKVKVDAANVVKTDIRCSNGIIHVIDRVILPESNTIPAVATKAQKFNTLLTAVKTAGLAEVLGSKGPFTVFAPTDAAFAKLPKGTVASLLKAENRAKLVAILKHHVVAGRVYSEAALKAKRAKTLQGSAVTAAVTDGGARINKAKLLATDIDAANGVIHVIDSVLLPPAKIGAKKARHMIESAIAKGSGLYNRGHHGACVKIYMETMQTLVDRGSMPTSLVSNLKARIRKAHHTDDMSTRAWTLRHALVHAYHNMKPLN